MNDTSSDMIRSAVRETYGRIAQTPQPAHSDAGDCCSPSTPPDQSSCCASPDSVSLQYGYSADDLAVVPDGADLGLGCGNPGAIAALMPGETVLDLGSGAGFDAFLAARAVGATGQVIGVDMTPAMVSRARTNAVEGGYTNVVRRIHRGLPRAQVRWPSRHLRCRCLRRSARGRAWRSNALQRMHGGSVDDLGVD